VVSSSADDGADFNSRCSNYTGQSLLALCDASVKRVLLFFATLESTSHAAVSYMPWLTAACMAFGK